MQPPVRAAVVTVGDELLIGRTVDTNSAWLGARLAELGLPVRERITVGDDDRDIREAVARALERARLVFVTGGLGPTDDDRTRPAVAELLEAPLQLDERLLSALEERFRSVGHGSLPPANRRQAMVPRGARVLPNAAGTAPGLLLEAAGGRAVVLLPGPPRELRAVFPAAADEIRRRLEGLLRPVHVRTLHTTGIAESVLAPGVEAALGEVREVEAAFLPDLTGVDVRLTVRDVEAAEAAARLDRAEAVLAPVVAPYRYHAPATGDLVEAVAARLSARGWSLATGESCTGGLVAKRLTDRPGASAWFPGGAVAYGNEAKSHLLGVPPEVIASEGAVSEAVARALARGARERFGADCGLGITGIAGPEGGSDEKPVGTVWYAVVTPHASESKVRRFMGDREAVRTRSAQAVLALLHRLLGEEGG